MADQPERPTQDMMPNERADKWYMSQERAYLEPLLNQRVNFLLVFFSLVVVGAVNAKSVQHFQIVLGLGAFVCWLLTVAIWRAQEKVDLILKDIFDTDKTHPATIINSRAKGGSRRRIVGFWVPMVCSVAITLGLILSYCGCLAPVLPK